MTKPPNTQDRFPRFLDDQRAFFDTLITEEWHTYQNPRWDAARQEEVTWLRRWFAGGRVLDVGCGCGYQDAVMAADPRVTAIDAIDYSEKSVAKAEAEFPHPKVRRAVADFFHWEPGGYDLVVSFQVIEHVRKAPEFLRRCAEKTRAGGRVAVFTPNAERWENRWARWRGKTPRLSDPQHFKEFTKTDLESLAAEAGLTLTAWRTTGLWLPLLSRWAPAAVDALGRALAVFAPGAGNHLAAVFEKPGAAA